MEDPMTPSEIKDAYLKHDRQKSLATLLGLLLSGLAFLLYPTPVPASLFSLLAMKKVLGILALICTLSCVLSFVSNLVGKMRLMRLHPSLCAEVEDERYRLNRLKAESWGFRIGGSAVFLAFVLSGKRPEILTQQGLWILFAVAVIPCTVVLLWLESPWREGH
jgi:hypothetical protein